MAMSQRQLAGILGVSPMTVSRALRGADGIGDKTRETIIRAARDHGVRFPGGDRASGRGDAVHHLVCAIVPMEDEQDEYSFYGRINAGIRRGAADFDAESVNCVMGDGGWPTLVARAHVDGVIEVGGSERDLADRPACPCPRVTVFCDVDGADLVTVDNFTGGFLLGRHLGDLGHRAAACIESDSSLGRERLAGLRSGLERRSGSVSPEMTIVEPQAGNEEDTRKEIDRLIERAGGTVEAFRSRVSVLACYNDLVAAAAVRHLESRGLRVPADMGVAGFDDALPPSMRGIRLTTVGAPLESIGAEAARMLYWRIESPDAPKRRLALQPVLVEGETVLPVNPQSLRDS